MTIAMSTRRRTRPDAPDGAPTDRRPALVGALGLGVLCVIAAVTFVVYPTYPNYDSLYSLVWGREILDGMRPSFGAYRAPTEHPLSVAFGIVLALLGEPGERVMLAATLISFVALAAGLYRLGRIAFTPVIGMIAAVLLCTRWGFPFLAVRGYIDIPYLAFVVWAAALEAERPRRGLPVYVLLILAGLLRPEAWVLVGLYWLWCAWRADWPTRIRQALLVGVAPIIWFSLDWWATGDPLFSLNHTSGLAEELGRQRGAREIPLSTVRFLRALAGSGVFWTGLLGMGIAIWAAPRRSRVPGALFLAGVGTFFLIGMAGLSVIDRYLLAPSLMLMVFAGVALGGWSMLTPGRLRTGWMVAAALGVVVGGALLLSRVNLERMDNELTFRGDSRAALEQVLDDPAVRAGFACGPVSVPNHKLLADVRWLADLGVDDVLARSDPDAAGKLDRGVWLVPNERTALLRQAIVTDLDDPLTLVPPPGFGRAAVSDFYAAYVRC